MKKVLTLIALCLAFASQAQITLEHTYPNMNVRTAKVTDSSFIYYYYDSTNLYIYSSNHTLEKTVPHSLSGTSNIYYVNQYTFDLDPGYEYIVWALNGSVWQFSILNDDNSVIMSGTGTASPLNTINGAKLMVSSTSDTKIYDLPGQHHTFRIKGSGVSTFDPYPNPSADWVRLPYELTGATGNLNIIDISGRIQKTYTISGLFKDVLLEPGALPAGQYFYYIEADGIQSNAKAFVIR